MPRAIQKRPRLPGGALHLFAFVCVRVFSLGSPLGVLYFTQRAGTPPPQVAHQYDLRPKGMSNRQTTRLSGFAGRDN